MKFICHRVFKLFGFINFQKKGISGSGYLSAAVPVHFMPVAGQPDGGEQEPVFGVFGLVKRSINMNDLIGNLARRNGRASTENMQQRGSRWHMGALEEIVFPQSASDV